jgi:hypothetical protein
MPIGARCVVARMAALKNVGHLGSLARARISRRRLRQRGRSEQESSGEGGGVQAHSTRDHMEDGNRIWMSVSVECRRSLLSIHPQ